MNRKAVVLNIYGRVQGVGFRYYTQKKAEELNITGFVKNRPDGSVYVEAEGTPEDLVVFTEWCEAGPPWARVRKVTRQEIPPPGYTSFDIR